LTGASGFRRMEAMVKHRSHSIEFKRQVAQEFLAARRCTGSRSATTSRAT
jgi:transposase